MQPTIDCRSQSATTCHQNENLLQPLTVTEVRGCGRQRGHKEIYRGSEYEVMLIPKVKIEVLVENKKTKNVVNTIIQNEKTGNI